MPSTHDYGKRNCMECGTEFTAVRPWTVTCSLECKEKRDIRLKRASKREYYHRNKEQQVNLKTQLEDSLKHIKFLEEELERLRKTKILPELESCERLSLKAIQLPCGTRRECFKPKRCVKCPESANEADIFDPMTLDKAVSFGSIK